MSREVCNSTFCKVVAGQRDARVRKARAMPCRLGATGRLRRAERSASPRLPGGASWSRKASLCGNGHVMHEHSRTRSDGNGQIHPLWRNGGWKAGGEEMG